MEAIIIIDGKGLTLKISQTMLLQYSYIFLISTLSPSFILIFSLKMLEKGVPKYTKSVQIVPKGKQKGKEQQQTTSKTKANTLKT